mmetsp:Transcript_96391/g.171345  ORF Transcript_96391/g.171345 Transcript_96391/m.171345 type:complete len:271 (-) Transcript_96391:132-944(-)
MDSTRIVCIHVDACEDAFASNIVGLVVAEPLAEELREVWICKRGVGDPKLSIAQPDRSQSVRVYPALALGKHILPTLIASKSPDLQGLGDVSVTHFSSGLGSFRQEPPRESIGQGALRLDVCTLVVPRLIGFCMQFVKIIAKILRNLQAEFSLLGLHLQGESCRTTEATQDPLCTRLAHLVALEAVGNLRARSSKHLQVASLILPEQIGRLRPQLQCFINCLGLHVSRVSLIRLASDVLWIRHVLDPRLPGEFGDSLVCFQSKLQPLTTL